VRCLLRRLTPVGKTPLAQQAGELPGGGNGASDGASNEGPERRRQRRRMRLCLRIRGMCFAVAVLARLECSSPLPHRISPPPLSQMSARTGRSAPLPPASLSIGVCPPPAPVCHEELPCCGLPGVSGLLQPAAVVDRSSTGGTSSLHGRCVRRCPTRRMAQCSHGAYRRFLWLRRDAARLLAVGWQHRPGSSTRAVSEAVGRCSNVCSLPAPACSLHVQGPEMEGAWSVQVLRAPFAPPPPPWLGALRPSSSARRGWGMRGRDCNRAACCARPRLDLHRRGGQFVLGLPHLSPLLGSRLP